MARRSGFGFDDAHARRSILAPSRFRSLAIAEAQVHPANY
jgi:hypothetical protein